MKDHDSPEATQAAAVAEQGAHVAPAKAASKKAVTRKKGAQGRESRQGYQTRKQSQSEEARQEDGTQSRRPARREQRREDPGHDRPRQGCDARRDHEGHRLAGAQRARVDLHRRQKAWR
jgi:hypothetical protein